MKMLSRWMLALIAVAALATLAASCSHEDETDEAEAFSFVVYPGSRYLAQLTELTKQAHKAIKPSEEPPPVAIYDTDASVEDVANFYAKPSPPPRGDVTVRPASALRSQGGKRFPPASEHEA